MADTDEVLPRGEWEAILFKAVYWYHKSHVQVYLW